MGCMTNSSSALHSLILVLILLSSHCSLLSLCKDDPEVGMISLFLPLYISFSSGYWYFRTLGMGTIPHFSYIRNALKLLAMCSRDFCLLIIVCGEFRTDHIPHNWTFCCILCFSAEDEDSFTYDKGTEKGPENWGLIKPEWRACKDGKSQSPIDLLSPRVQVSSHLGKLKRDYKPAPATIRNRGHDITVSHFLVFS